MRTGFKSRRFNEKKPVDAQTVCIMRPAYAISFFSRAVKSLTLIRLRRAEGVPLCRRGEEKRLPTVFVSVETLFSLARRAEARRLIGSRFNQGARRKRPHRVGGA